MNDFEGEMVSVLLPRNWTLTVFALVFSWVVMWPSLHITSPVTWFLDIEAYWPVLKSFMVFVAVENNNADIDVKSDISTVLQYFTLSRPSASPLFPSHVPEAIFQSICVTMMNGSWLWKEGKRECYVWICQCFHSSFCIQLQFKSVL